MGMVDGAYLIDGVYLAGIATFFRVFLLVFQSQSVINGIYIWAAITPFLIAITEVSIVLLVVKEGWPSVPYVGIGGSIGAVSSMYVHRRWIKK